MNLETLKYAKYYIEKMANGINPLTNENIPDTELLNNIRISRCLFYVNNVLGEILSKEEQKQRKNKKIPFKLTKEDLNKFEYSNTPIPVSIITKELNKLNPNNETSKLKATDITNWLVNLGILIEKEINGKKYKLPTETGKSIGLYIEERIGYNGGYYIVQYPKQSQEFIIDNFENLIEFVNK